MPCFVVGEVVEGKRLDLVGRNQAAQLVAAGDQNHASRRCCAATTAPS
jgi:hypothetical protein